MTATVAECELLMEALNRELAAVKEQLAILAHHLDVNKLPSSLVSPLPPIEQNTSPIERKSTISPHPLTPLQSAEPLPHNKEEVLPLTRAPKKVIFSAPKKMCKEMSEHLLKVVDDREKEKTRTRKRYLTLMRTHIENQLQDLRERAAKLRKNRERRERKEKAARLELKPPRFRSSGLDDKRYLDNVYKGFFYEIVNMEHNLKRAGQLKTISELTSFWRYMLSPLEGLVSPAVIPPPGEENPSYFIRDECLEEEEEEDKDCTNSWAITVSPPTGEEKLTKHSDPITIPIHLMKTPKRPELLPLKEIMNESGEQGAMVNQRCPNITFKETTKHFRQVRAKAFHIYQRARANEMAMKSILPCLPSIECPAYFTSISTLSLVPDHTEVEPTSTLDQMLPWSTLTVNKRLLEPISDLVEPALKLTHSSKRNLIEKDTPLKIKYLKPKEKTEQINIQYPLPLMVEPSLKNVVASSDAKPPPSKPVSIPLTMDELLETRPVKESKRRSTMWTNYLLV